MTIAATGQQRRGEGGIVKWIAPEQPARCPEHNVALRLDLASLTKRCEQCHKEQRHEERKAARRLKKRAEDRARRSRTTCGACGCLILRHEKECPGCLAALVGRMTGNLAEWMRTAA